MARLTRSFKLGSKTNWRKVSRILYPRTTVILSVSEGMFYVYLFTCTLSATWSDQFLQDLALIKPQWSICYKTPQKYVQKNSVQSVHQWSGRPGFNPRSSHTKDLKKWYLIPPCLTLGIIRYASRVKWRNPGKGVAPSPTPRCSSYWKGSLRIALDNSRQLYFISIWSVFLKL